MSALTLAAETTCVRRDEVTWEVRGAVPIEDEMDGRRIALVLVTKLVRTNVLPAVAEADDGTRSG